MVRQRSARERGARVWYPGRMSRALVLAKELWRSTTRGLPVLVLVSGCAMSHWRSKHKAPDYSPAARMFLAVEVSEEVAELDDSGQVATLVESLQDELKSRGIRLTLADPENSKQYPRILLLIHSSTGAPTGLATYGYGTGSIVIDCTVRAQPHLQPSFAGRLSGSAFGGAMLSDSTAAGEAAARSIAAEIASED